MFLRRRKDVFTEDLDLFNSAPKQRFILQHSPEFKMLGVKNLLLNLKTIDLWPL